MSAPTRLGAEPAIVPAPEAGPRVLGSMGSFYGDLERLLRKQLQDNPRLHHVRVKLLDLYHETARSEDFMREARILANGFDRRANPAEWKRLVTMGRSLGLNDPIFRETYGDGIDFTATLPGPVQALDRRRFGDDDTSRPLFAKLAAAYESLRAERRFLAEFDLEVMHQLNRPSSLYHARRLSAKHAGAQLYFKREDFSPPGTRYSLGIIGQALLARRLGLSTVIAATSNGQKGAVVASVAARLGLRATVFMDKEDEQRHSAQVFRMRLHGATVNAVDRRRYPGADLRQAALECWHSQPRQSLLLMGLDAAPAPYPRLGADLAGVIGRETKRQAMAVAKRMPDTVVARGGENADAVGFLDVFIDDKDTRLVCVEGARELGPPDANADGKLALTNAEQRVAGAIMERLEYPSVTREHALLRSSGRVEYPAVSTDAARQAIVEMAALEGILAPIQTAHAIAWACRHAATLRPDQAVVVMLAEQADKDVWEIMRGMKPGGS